MHLNYHFFKFLCPELQKLLAGKQLTEAFSQNKHELILAFENEGEEHFIRAHLSPANTCLSFPENFERKKANTASLFPELTGDRVLQVNLIPFERAFYLQFQSGKKLLFKMHGSRSNILLYEDRADVPVSLFRNGLGEDRNLRLDALEKKPDLSKSSFYQLEGNASQFLPTLGKVPREWLKQNGYLEADLEERWKLMQEMMDMLDTPYFQIHKQGPKFILTMLPVEEAVFSADLAIPACNAYFKFAVIQGAFDKEKQHWTKILEEQQKKSSAYIQKSKEKLQALLEEAPPSQVADIIMANLHRIPEGAELVTLFDFYQDRQIDIIIKRGMKPQQHAANLYRKSKNRKIEIDQIQKNIQEKEMDLKRVEIQLQILQEITHFKDLRAYLKEEKLIRNPNQKEEQVPFKRFEIDGYDIWVGKSAKANDEMLRNFAWKDDLWLHAKDVSGSHVIIKHRSGQNYPKNLIERAAELAAYYSKNKNESFAPVMYTPCKFVRKVKGAAPGAVMVDKEQVLMVTPRGPE